MHKFACLLLAVAWVRGDDAPAIELPEDPQAVVVLLEYKGGFRAPQKHPPLEIRRDGTVRIAWTDQLLEDRLPEKDLIALLRFAVTTCRFFEFDAEAVAGEIRAAGGNPELIVEDAASTAITIALRDRKGTRSWHALGWAARQHPKLRALQDLRALDLRLENLMWIVRAGGRERAAGLLEVANRQLREDHPDVEPLALEHLRSTHRWANGTLDLRFERKEADRTVRVSVHAPAGGEPSASVELEPDRLRRSLSR